MEKNSSESSFSCQALAALHSQERTESNFDRRSTWFWESPKPHRTPIKIPEQLKDKIEILAKEHGISAAELVGSLVKSDFEELVDFAETITRLRTAVEPVSLAEMRRKLGFDGPEG